MLYGDFIRRFREDQEIGRDLGDTHLAIYFDNGVDVGAWREDRRTTVGAGEVLGTEDAEMARYWYRRRGATCPEAGHGGRLDAADAARRREGRDR